MKKYLALSLLIFTFAFTSQAVQQTINNGETMGQARGKINDNFTDLYTNKADIEGIAFTASALSDLTVIGTTQTAGSFTAGIVYEIVSIGTTDFTLIGADANTVGLTFTAIGVGEGTGTASPYWPVIAASPLEKNLQTYTATAVDTLLTAVIVPTIQTGDPTDLSTVGWYAATTSGDTFFKSIDGLFNVSAGTYTVDPVRYTLTITNPGNGDIVSSSDTDLSAPIDCGDDGTDCIATVITGQEVSGLAATAASGRYFSAWTGDITSSENPTTTALTMGANKAVGATFYAYPTITTSTIGVNGLDFTLTGPIAMSVGSGGSSGLNVDCSTAGDNVAATYASGGGTTSLVFTLGTAINQTETCNVDYTQPGNGLEATTGGGDLATISNGVVTNNSQVSSGGYGPELITVAADREFSSDTGYWTKTNVTISGGTLNFTGTAYSNVQRSAIVADYDATSYTATFDLTISSGLIKVGQQSGSDGTTACVFTTSGSKTCVFDFSSNRNFVITTSDPGGTATVDNISLKENL